MSNDAVERRLRLEVEELIARAAGPPAEVAEGFERLDGAVAAAVEAGAVPPSLAHQLLHDAVDALALRGATWLVPTLPDLDVAALYEAAWADDRPEPVEEPSARAPSPAAAADLALPWWVGLAPFDVDGPSGAGDHRIRWEEGRLVLLAHADPEAEATLAALGADRCPCLDVATAWRAAHCGSSFLTVAARHPAEELQPLATAVTELGADSRRWRTAAAELAEDVAATSDVQRRARVHRLVESVERRIRERLGHLLLLGLDGRLHERLQASVAAVAEPGAALEVATAARVRPVLRAIGLPVDLDRIRIGPEPAVDTEEVVVPPRWLAEVWGRGLATAVPGHLVVEVVAVAPGGAVDVVAAAPGKARVALRVDQWENAGVASTPGAT